MVGSRADVQGGEEMKPTTADLNDSQRNAAAHGLDLSMPCAKCGYPMKRVIVGRDWRGVIRCYRCERCDGKIPAMREKLYAP